MNVKELAARAAVIKAVKDSVTVAERQTKAALAQVLDPADRKGAVLADGTDIGTVSYSKGRSTGGWKITDPEALTAWAEEHQADAIVPGLAAWFTAPANIEALVKSGEVPDGVEYAETTSEPYVTVRQTDAQRVAVAQAWRAGQLTAVVSGLLEIES